MERAAAGNRGLYELPLRINPLTKQPGATDPRAVIAAVAHRYGLRVLIDGIVAANDLGLTTAVPAKVVVRVDGCVKSIWLGNLKIDFRKTSPRRMYWAGRPAARVVEG